MVIKQTTDDLPGKMVASADPPEFEDKFITCVICGDEFIWNAGEQQFYKDRLLSPPRRCHACRLTLRRQRGG